MKDVLLVEDSDADATLVEHALESLSVANHVQHVTTGEEAIAYLNRAAEAAAVGLHPASVLILDLFLPDMSGLRILEQMLGRLAFNKTLRIVLSNLSHMKAIQRAYALGAHSFLTKPVHQADLVQLIEAFPGYWAFTAKIENPFRLSRNPVPHGEGVPL